MTALDNSECPSSPLLAAALETTARLQEQLRQSQKMEVVGLLAGGIAHDFNNLLTIINGYNEMLLTSCELPPEARKCVTVARDAGEHAAALVRGLLAFSRRHPLEPELVDLNESAAELSTLVSRLLPANIKLSTSLAPNLNSVLADPGAIQQVLLNLVVNSRDAMPDGGEIKVETSNLNPDTSSSTAHPYLPPGEYVLLTVSDNGIGMDDETRQRLFEPFYTTKPSGVGTGLGMPMVQQIVKRSGGFLSVQSSRGAGATVRIYLPARDGQKLRVPGELARTLRGGSETVLLVEGNAELRHLLRASLDSLGYSVLDAANAAEAEALSDGLDAPIDLLVSDVVLSDCKGMELGRRLQQRRRELPALYISGHAEVEALGNVPESSAQFLAKPFSLASFGDRVRNLLDRRRRQRILVVDDDAEVVMFVSRVLRGAGYEVLVGANGNVALSTVATEPIDLVITDLVMPEREGLETIMRLRKGYPDLPIIAISGAFGGHFLKGASTLGATAALPKPFSGEELLYAVQSVLAPR